MKGIITKILVLVLIASLFGCSGSGNMNKESDPYEGVTVSADINTGKNKAGNTVYDLYGSKKLRFYEELFFICNLISIV